MPRFFSEFCKKSVDITYCYAVITVFEEWKRPHILFIHRVSLLCCKLPMINVSTIISYHIMSCHIISYHIISYHIISFSIITTGTLLWVRTHREREYCIKYYQYLERTVVCDCTLLLYKQSTLYMLPVLYTPPEVQSTLLRCGLFCSVLVLVLLCTNRRRVSKNTEKILFSFLIKKNSLCMYVLCMVYILYVQK